MINLRISALTIMWSYPSIHLHRFLWFVSVQTSIWLSPEWVVARDLAKNPFLDLTTMLSTTESGDKIGFLRSLPNCRIILEKRRRSGSSSIIQNVGGAIPMSGLPLGGQAPSETAGEFSWQFRVWLEFIVPFVSFIKDKCRWRNRTQLGQKGLHPFGGRWRKVQRRWTTPPFGFRAVWCRAGPLADNLR